jgi:hypothetical protein
MAASVPVHPMHNDAFRRLRSLLPCLLSVTECRSRTLLAQASAGLCCAQRAGQKQGGQWIALVSVEQLRRARMGGRCVVAQDASVAAQDHSCTACSGTGSCRNVLRGPAAHWKPLHHVVAQDASVVAQDHADTGCQCSGTGSHRHVTTH